MIPLEDIYGEWALDGFPRDVNGSVPHEVKCFYLQRALLKFDLRTLVESGTSRGDAVNYLLPYVDDVYTVEAWDEAYQFSKDRFKDEPKVHLYFGDSAEIFPEILNEIGPAVFWLDAHYSGDGTAKLDKQTPVVAELEAIAASDQKHCIVIDDARGFGVWDDYPTVEWVGEFSKTNFPDHDFYLDGDEIFIMPRYERDCD